MTFFSFGDYLLAEENITKTITQQQRWPIFFGSRAQAQADLSMAIDGKPNAVLMPGLDCSPNGPVWTNFANFRLFFNRQALGYFGLET